MEVAHAGFKLYGVLSQYIRDYVDASKHIRHFADEVRTPSWALQHFGALLKGDDDIRLCKPEAISETEAALTGCQTALNQVSDIIKDVFYLRLTQMPDKDYTASRLQCWTCFVQLIERTLGKEALSVAIVLTPRRSYMDRECVCVGKLNTGDSPRLLLQNGSTIYTIRTTLLSSAFQYQTVETHIAEMGNTSSRPMPPPPKPASSVGAYTLPRMKKGLGWADRSLKRKPSPPSAAWLKSYREVVAESVEACKDGSFRDDERNELAYQMWGSEIDLSGRLFPRSANQKPRLDYQELEQQVAVLKQQLVEVQPARFLCRYGDYAAGKCQGLRATAMKSGLENQADLSGNTRWTAISKRLHREQQYYDSGDMLEAPMDFLVNHLCRAESLNTQDTILEIHLYAARNNMAHSPIQQCLETGNYAKLASLLHRDEADLDKLCPQTLLQYKDVLRRIIVELRAQWFWMSGPGLLEDFDGEELDESTRWWPKDKLWQDMSNVSEAAVRKRDRVVEAEAVVNLGTDVAGRLKTKSTSCWKW